MIAAFASASYTALWFLRRAVSGVLLENDAMAYGRRAVGVHVVNTSGGEPRD